MPTESLQEIRASIITDVLTRGLLPGNLLRENGDLFVGSYDESDEEQNDEVLFVRLQPNTHYREIIYMLYPTLTGSLFPIVSERYKNHAESTEVATERTTASFLVVCKEQLAKEGAKYVIDAGYKWNDGLNIPGVITPEKFSHLVFPRRIWIDYTEFSPHPLTASPILIDDEVHRYLYINNKVRFQAPNYERVLLQLSREITEPHLVHIVRLPTIQDILEVQPDREAIPLLTG